MNIQNYCQGDGIAYIIYINLFKYSYVPYLNFNLDTTKLRLPKLNRDHVPMEDIYRFIPTYNLTAKNNGFTHIENGDFLLLFGLLSSTAFELSFILTQIVDLLIGDNCNIYKNFF
jgi:hypothetical protein